MENDDKEFLFLYCYGSRIEADFLLIQHRMRIITNYQLLIKNYELNIINSKSDIPNSKLNSLVSVKF